MKNIFKYIPMVTLGQILGTVVGFPLLCFLINIFYYSNKYNDDAEQYYKEYMNNSYDIEVIMPEEKSKYYLETKTKILRHQKLSEPEWIIISLQTHKGNIILFIL